jgi:hypothetical protein
MRMAHGISVFLSRSRSCVHFPFNKGTENEAQAGLELPRVQAGLRFRPTDVNFKKRP